MYKILVLLLAVTTIKCSINTEFSPVENSIAEDTGFPSAMGKFTNRCDKLDLMCRSVRLVKKIIDKIIDSENITISENVKIVQTAKGDVKDDGRGFNDSFMERLKRFLSTHELQVKLPDILPTREEINGGLQAGLQYLSEIERGDEESGRKGGGGGGGGGIGGKKGGGGILMMATMMGGTMAALGFGAVGMLAMKALTVSAMALMLSAVIGLKKLMSKGGDDGGGHHSVSYIPVHGGAHRRRRSLPQLAYRGYNQLKV